MCSAWCVAPMHLSMITVRPAAAARAAASSFVTPSWSQRTFAFAAMASSAIAGVSSERRNTSTMSIGSAMSASDATAFWPWTSVSRGLTGMTR